MTCDLCTVVLDAGAGPLWSPVIAMLIIISADNKIHFVACKGAHCVNVLSNESQLSDLDRVTSARVRVCVYTQTHS